MNIRGKLSFLVDETVWQFVLMSVVVVALGDRFLSLGRHHRLMLAAADRLNCVTTTGEYVGSCKRPSAAKRYADALGASAWPATG